jgi:hypothetical protein
MCLDEQIAVFHQEISNVQELLLKAPSFQAFVKELTAEPTDNDIQ